jgi:CheY-like chemotaxis protein
MDPLAKRVLVVDDDAPIRLFESAVLKDAGYAVSQARDGAAAIEHLAKTLTDLVVLDIRMPGIDGWGVLEHIARMPAPPRVVIVSGVSDLSAPQHLATHVARTLAKPFAAPDLLKVCAQVLTP